MLLINCGGAQKDFFHGVLKVGWIFFFLLENVVKLIY
jgi:hypothetical protein